MPILEEDDEIVPQDSHRGDANVTEIVFTPTVREIGMNATTEPLSPKGKPMNDLLQQAIAAVQERKYISFNALCRILSIPDHARDEFLNDLRTASQEPHSMIGEVSEAEANRVFIQPNVFYSKDWADVIFWPAKNEMKIGADLYQRILDNGWAGYGNDGLFDFRPLFNALKDICLDCIISGEQSDPVAAWRRFVQMYAEDVNYDRVLERYLDVKERLPQAVEEWRQRGGRRREEVWRSMIAKLDCMDQLGFALASYYLGALYHNEEYVANALFQRAHNEMWRFVGRSHGHAELCLARMYFSGWGCEKNYEEAARWCEQARSLGTDKVENLLRQCRSHLKKISSQNGEMELHP